MCDKVVALSRFLFFFFSLFAILPLARASTIRTAWSREFIATSERCVVSNNIILVLVQRTQTHTVKHTHIECVQHLIKCNIWRRKLSHLRSHWAQDIAAVATLSRTETQIHTMSHFSEKPRANGFAWKTCNGGDGCTIASTSTSVKPKHTSVELETAEYLCAFEKYDGILSLQYTDDNE